MSTQITLKDAMSLKDSAGNASFLDIRFAVLNNLSQGWYSYDMLTAADGEITGVGSVLYRIQYYPISKEYSGNINTQNLQIETVEVEIDTKDCIGYEIEDMDLAQIIAAPAIQANAASNVATSIKATKNAKMFDKLNTFLVANPANTYYLPELVSESDLTTDQYRSIQKKILMKRTKMSQIISHKYINIDPTNFFGIIAPKAHTNFEMLLTALNISTAAMDLLKFGIGGMGKGGSVANLGGTPFISDPFLGQVIAANASFSEKAFDFSKNVGYMLIKDAVAYPAKWGKMQILPNPANLNTMVKAKWYTGFGVLRPELICGFVSELYTNAPSTGVNVTAAAGSSHTFQIVHSDCGNRTITYASDAESYATVSDAGLITGVAAGTANITIKEGTTVLATIAVTVA